MYVSAGLAKVCGCKGMWMHTYSWPSCLVETKKDLARQREEGRAKKSMCKVLDLKEHQDSWGQETGSHCVQSWRRERVAVKMLMPKLGCLLKKKAYLDDYILFLMPKLWCNNRRFLILPIWNLKGIFLGGTTFIWELKETDMIQQPDRQRCNALNHWKENHWQRHGAGVPARAADSHWGDGGH